MSPEDMLTFAAVARQGGVRRGAEALGIPRSTVSRRLVRLERALGGRLVARSTRQFALTDLGQRLAEQCTRLEEVVAATEAILERDAREPSGTLCVAASPIIGEEFLTPVVAEYLRRWPRVRMNVRLSVEFVDLRKAGVDVAVRTGPLQDASDLFAIKLGTSLKGHYASRSYLKSHRPPESPEELAEHDCIVIGGKQTSVWTFRGRRGELQVPVSGSLRVDSYRLARSAAAAGVGVARLPSLFAEPLVRTGELVAVLEDYWEKTIIYAVHAAGQPAPPKIRAFVEILQRSMKRALG
jgi:DNA-binding transcriptional LysR family regulator